MFPQLFHAVPDALIVVDEAGRIAIANRQAERLFGYGPGELAGQPAGESSGSIRSRILAAREIQHRRSGPGRGERSR